MTDNRTYWIQSAIYSVFERFGVKLFGFGTIFFLMRALDQSQWGIWALFLMVGSLMEMARNGLIQNAKVKYLASATPEEYGRILSASTLINICLTLVIAAILLGLADWIEFQFNSPKLAPLIRIYTLTSIVLIPFAQCNFVQQANLQFKGILVSNLVRQGLFFSYVAWLFFQYKSNGAPVELEKLAWFQFYSAIAGSLVSIFYAGPYLKFHFGIDISWLKKLLGFGMFTFGTSLSTFLYKSIDRGMLGKLKGPTGVALIDPALRITEIMEIPIQAMAAIVYPQSARKMSSEGPKGVRKLYEQSVGAVFGLILPFCIIVLLFPSFFIWLIAGSNPDYAFSSVILRVTILYTLFVPFGRQFGTTLDSIGKPVWSFIFVLTGAFLNFFSNLLFIREFGVIGAAYGTLLTLVLKFIAQQIILYRILNVKTLNVFKYTWSYYKQAPGFLLRVLKEGKSAFKIRDK